VVTAASAPQQRVGRAEELSPPKIGAEEKSQCALAELTAGGHIGNAKLVAPKPGARGQSAPSLPGTTLPEDPGEREKGSSLGLGGGAASPGG